MLNVAVMLLSENIVMSVLLVELLALGDLVLICRLSLHRQHRSRLVMLTMVKLLSNIRLHFQDKSAAVD